MASAALDLVINLKGDADKQIGGLSKSILGLSKSAVGVGATISKAIGGIAIGGAIAGVAGLGAALVSGIRDAREANIVLAQTEAVIKSTGGVAGITAAQVSALAASLSAASGKSLFGDDMIQESTNLLLTFTNLEKGVLEAATAISVDMAQALGGAPADAAVQLGKALQDPIAGLSALTRVGVTFTEEQKNLIASLVETGDTAGAQQVILAELNKEFGGSAAAAAAADGGFAQFRDRMGELAESVGTMVLPALNSLMGLLNSPEVQAGIEAFVGGLVTGLTNIATFIGTNVLPVVSEAIGRIGEVLSDILTPIRDVATAFNEWKAFGTEWGIVAALEAIGDAFPAVQPVTDWLASVMPGAVQGVREAFGLARDAVQTFKDALAGDWKNAEQIHPLHAAVGAFGLLIKDTIIPALGDLVTWVGTNTPAAWDTFKKSIDEDVMPALRVLGSWFEEKTPVIDTHTGKVISGTSAWDRYAERLSHNFGIIKTEFDTFITNLENKTRREDEETKKQTGFWENYKTSLDNWLIFLQNDFNTFTTTIGGHMDRMNQDMNTSLTNAVAAVALFVGDAIAVIGTMPGLIKGAVTTWGTILKAAGIAVIQGFIDGLQSMIPTISQVLGGITALIPRFKGPPEKDTKLLYSSGQLIIGGLIDGFGSMVPRLVSALSGLTAMIGDIFNDALVGAPIVEGMGEGIMVRIGRLGNTLAFAAQALAQQAADAAVAIAVAASAKLAEAMASGSEAAIESARKAAEAATEAAAEATEAIGRRVLDSLFAMGSAFSSIGGFAAGMFKRQQLDPVTGRLKEIADELKEIDKAAAALNVGGVLGRDTAEGERLEARKAELLREQTKEKEKQAAIEAKLLRLQEQQQQLGWMQQQQKLVDMISQFGLDPSVILGDLKLGIGASVEGIMEAMQRAMEAVLRQINERMGGGATGPGEGKVTNTASMPNLMTMPAMVPVGIGPARAGVSNIYTTAIEEGAIVIVQQPGQDARQLAREVIYEMDREMERRRNR